MRVLVDTSILLWWLTNDPKLSTSATNVLASTETVVFLSTATLWELRIKQAIAKVTLPSSFSEDLAREGFEVLSIHPAHVHALSHLPLHHRDPFDRLLIAQAILENLTIVTHDETFTKYEVKCLLV